MKIIGHRGAMGHEPENTLRSIRKAMELGADMVEFDVFVLSTGQAILMHDDLVDRTTNGEGYVLDLSFDELRQLDAGHGEQIPTLQEVIEAVDRRVPVNIELKGFDAAEPVAGIIARYLGHGWKPQDFVVSSFNHPELHKFHQLMPAVEIIALIYAIPLTYAAYAEELRAFGAAPATDHVTQAFVDDAHRRGMVVCAWVWEPVHDRETRRLQALGVDYLFSDHPDRTRAALVPELAKPSGHHYREAHDHQGDRVHQQNH